jgi:hypothetical protein
MPDGAHAHPEQIGTGLLIQEQAQAQFPEALRGDPPQAPTRPLPTLRKRCICILCQIIESIRWQACSISSRTDSPAGCSGICLRACPARLVRWSSCTA